MSIVLQFLTSRNTFFNHRHSERVQRAFLQNESRILNLLEQLNVEQTLRNLLNNATIMVTEADLAPPVPSVVQLNEGLITVLNPDGACSICQEALNIREAARLRNCGHTFHRSCATTWYSRSAVCPLCRNDIRTAPVQPTNE
jgi:hypothetical protein